MKIFVSLLLALTTLSNPLYASGIGYLCDRQDSSIPEGETRFLQGHNVPANNLLWMYRQVDRAIFQASGDCKFEDLANSTNYLSFVEKQRTACAAECERQSKLAFSEIKSRQVKEANQSRENDLCELSCNRFKNEQIVAYIYFQKGQTAGRRSAPPLRAGVAKASLPLDNKNHFIFC
jgi:hypothetical protein